MKHLLLVLGCCALVWAQNPEERVVLDHADVIRSSQLGRKMIRELQGNVIARYKGMTYEFQIGRYDMEDGILHCMQEVLVYDSTRSLSADAITLYEADERVVARGKVHAWGDSLDVRAQTATWWDGLRRGRLERAVHIDDFENGLALDAGEVLLDDSLGYMRAVYDPVLTRLRDPHTVLTAEVLDYWRDEQRATAKRNVVLNSVDFNATCDSLCWLDSLSLVQFHIDPVLLREERRIEGVVIHAYTNEDNRLDSLLVLGEARVTSPSDSVSALLLDCLEGEEIICRFKESELAQIQVNGSARSVLFARDDRGQPGVNVADASHMLFQLEERHLEQVDMGGGVSAFWMPLKAPPGVKDGNADSLRGAPAGPTAEEGKQP